MLKKFKCFLFHVGDEVVLQIFFAAASRIFLRFDSRIFLIISCTDILIITCLKKVKKLFNLGSLGVGGGGDVENSFDLVGFQKICGLEF